jgi:competence protein ComEC
VGFVRSQLVVVSMSLSGAAIIILMASVYFSRPDDQLHVWFLDVGHSNAVLIETPGGSQILVDGGRFPSRLLTSIGDRLPFTDREIELMIITQPNEFNYAAATSVLDRYDIGVALTNGQPNLSDSFVELESKLAVHDIVVARAGYTVEFDDGAKFEILNPQTLPTLGDSINDNALVLRLSYGDVSFLLTSDLSAEAQIELSEAENYPLATVLQLPQHGTARSLERDFIEAVQPQAVVVQADRANRRGDPDPAILAMLDKDTPVFRTDEDGVVHLWTNGESLWGETEN